jgi:hypothetical protein
MYFFEFTPSIVIVTKWKVPSAAIFLPTGKEIFFPEVVD